jgi:hypothetical protein
MGSNKRDLKAYVRYDGSGRVVAGSLILRRSKPKVGKWKEIQGYQCCNAPTLNSGELNSFPYEPAAFVVYCNSSAQYIYINTDIDVANITELVAALNATGSNVGIFSIAPDGVTVNLTLSIETAVTFKDCLNDLFFETFENL